MTGRTCIASDDGIVVNWLAKMVITIGVLAFIAFEILSPVIARLQAGDTASQAAAEANIILFNTGNLEEAERTAEEYVEKDKVEFVKMEVDRTADELRVTARKTAKTMLVHRISALRKYTRIRVTEAVPLRH